MKYLNSFCVIFMILVAPVVASAQVDTTQAKKDTVTANKVDTTFKTVSDTAAKAPAVAVAVAVAPVKTNADTVAIAATPMNCYKQYLDYFNDLGSKPVTDGEQLIVIAFKSKESCHCYMGKVTVAGGKIKAPIYVQTEGGDFKTFTALGKKLDQEFLAAQGDALWSITNGMSVVFQTTESEYGRIFFYKFLNKNKQMTKEAPSPSDLLK